MRHQLDTLRGLRVAFLHDWLFHMRGGENCLNDLCELFPNSEIFTLFTDEQARLDEVIASRPIISGIFSKLPGIRRFYRMLLPLFPIAVRDLEKRLAARHKQHPFDLVISASHCAVKNVRVPKGLSHICYCLTPARYLWDQFDRYVRNPIAKILSQPLRAALRRWDVRGASHVTQFIAISEFVALRIARVYNRSALVVYPGVLRPQPGDTTRLNGDRDFLCVNALVPYKNTHLIVQAFRELNLPLTIVGAGPEQARLRRMAGPRTKFTSGVSRSELWQRYRDARALLFAAEEDFGMTPVESQFVGRPVIFYARGGACETVIDGETGVGFEELSVKGICAAVRRFLDRENRFSLESCRLNAERFSRDRFATSFLTALSSVGAVEADDAVSRRAALH